MNMNSKKLLVVLVGVFFLPSFALADYSSSYQQVISDYERGFNSVAGSQTTGNNNQNSLENDHSIAPPLALPALFTKPKTKEQKTSLSTNKENYEEGNNKLAYNSYPSGNNVMYQGSVKESLRRTNGTQLSASVVNTAPMATSSSSSTPYGTLLLVIVMLFIVVFLAWFTSIKRRRLHQRYLEKNYREQRLRPEY